MAFSPHKTLQRSPNNYMERAISPPSQNKLSLTNVISSDPLLLSYFSQHSVEANFTEFAKKLMLDGIRYRSKDLRIQSHQAQVPCSHNQRVSPSKEQRNVQQNSKSKQKHYNVAYVKHNRFLSPSQRKKVVTPKVTQMIPAKSPPHVIYGKPKVKIDEECGCPYHSDEEQERIKYQKQYIYEQPQQERYENIEERQTEKNFMKTSPRVKTETLRKKKKDEPNTNVIYVDKIVKVQSKKPIKIMNSPKYEESQMSEDDFLKVKTKNRQKKKKQGFIRNTESKIKYLIDKDKNNKRIEKELKRQQNKIKELERKVQKGEKTNKILISEKLFSKEDLSYSSSGFSEADGKILNYQKQEPKAFPKTNYKLHNEIGSSNAQGSSFSDFNDGQNSSSLSEGEGNEQGIYEQDESESDVSGQFSRF